MESKCLSGSFTHPGKIFLSLSQSIELMHSTSGPSHNEHFSISQGLGLFAARDIEKQSMVIEYNGTILRNEVAVMKEKSYRSQVKH